MNSKKRNKIVAHDCLIIKVKHNSWSHTKMFRLVNKNIVKKINYKQCNLKFFLKNLNLIFSDK